MRFIGVLLCLSLSGCGSYFPPNRNISDALTNENIVGTWIITPQSKDLMKRYGSESRTNYFDIITFKADKSCLLKKEGVSDGTWELKHDVLEHRIVKKNEIWIHGQNGVTLSVGRENGALVFFVPHGDPDQFEF